MITDFDDFCLWVYVVVDDLCQKLAAQRRRPGPQPGCSDSELIAMSLIGECRGWDQETELLSYMQEHRDKFPIVPEQSRFNRRRRQLMGVINQIRRMMLEQIELAQDQHCVLDSVPMPVVEFHLAPSSRGDWPAHGADFGKVSSKKKMIFGYKLHLLTTVGGLILDFALAPASATDLSVGCELLTQYSDLLVIGDKGYISAEIAEDLWQRKRIRLLTLPRAIRSGNFPSLYAASTTRSAKSSRLSTVSWPLNLTSKPTMLTLSGACVPVSTPS